MKKLFNVIFPAFLFSVIFFSCNKDDTVSSNEGNTNTGPVTQTYTSNPNRQIAPTSWTLDSLSATTTGINATSVSGLKLNLNTLENVTMSNLRFVLAHNGTEVLMIDNITNLTTQGNITNLVLWDSAAASIMTVNGYPITGTYRPLNQLSGFNNFEASGYWTLKIYNSGSLRTGVIKSWGITITYRTVQTISQWQPIATMTNAGIHTLFFLDVNNGWMYGKVGNVGTVYKTSNGGTSWTEILRDTVSQNSFNSMYFFDNTNGFACGGNGEVWKTTNGGRDWYGQNIPGNVSLRGIQFLNSSTGLICGGNNGGVPPVIYKTTDGGLYWSGGTISGWSYLECICFADATTAYAAGDYDIVKSDDGGSTWSTLITYGSIYRGEFPSIHFLNANTGYVAAGRDGILYTSNGGLNWTSRNPNPVFGVRSVYCTDINTCYIAGADTLPYVGRIYKSTNSGLDWNLQLSVPNFYMGYVQFLNANTGFAGGVDNPQTQANVVLYKTTTGGSK
jgi:photosystem II stability/assembly factor-like uncharacterized protein